jgi:adenine-specific DNA methylase
VLLNRYLGNKTSILPQILAAVRRYCSPGDSVFDAFSGSLSVSLALKAAGYRVAATDLNQLSRTFAEAYLLPTTIAEYQCDTVAILGRRRAATLERLVHGQLARLVDQTGFAFLADGLSKSTYVDLLVLIGHLATVTPRELPKEFLRADFFDAYCPDGKKSRFTSSRGRTGRRRFFLTANAHRLDLALCQLRAWNMQGMISATVLALLTAVVCLASEKVANTQGTWHDFPRDDWDARALNPIRLLAPPLDQVLVPGGGHRHGREEDAVTFARGLPEQVLAYLDPPYNFRQYTAYYHLPNTICRYPTLIDPNDYFSKLEYVRGQNMADDRPSEYCSSRTFLASMKGLLEAIPADTVVVSYFTGRNHWSTQFDSGPSDVGLEMLSGLLRSEQFEAGSLQVHRVPRTNYASYGGYSARQVDELLLIAHKRRTGSIIRNSTERASLGDALSVSSI